MVNSTHLRRRTNTSGSPSKSACSWIFALILCCLPGLSLVDAALTASDAPHAAASPAGLLHTTNTQATIYTHDNALTSSQRLVSHTKRSGVSYQNTPTESADPSGPALAIWPLPTICNLRTLRSGQGYDIHSLCLVTRHAAAPYSPRSPPVPA